jgi:hypothetical protein
VSAIDEFQTMLGISTTFIRVIIKMSHDFRAAVALKGGGGH